MTLLQAYTQTGDAEAVETTAIDKRWQLVLGTLGSGPHDQHPPAPTPPKGERKHTFATCSHLPDSEHCPSAAEGRAAAAGPATDLLSLVATAPSTRSKLHVPAYRCRNSNRR